MEREEQKNVIRMNCQRNHPKIQLQTRGSKRSSKNTRGDYHTANHNVLNIKANMNVEDGKLNRHTHDLGYALECIFIRTTNVLYLHVGNTCKNRGDVKQSIDQLAIATSPKPAELPITKAAVEEILAVVEEVVSLSLNNHLLNHRVPLTVH